jgi:hypothetical protein
MEVAQNTEGELQNIHGAIESLVKVTEAVQNRLQIIESELDMRTFQLDTMPIKPKKGPLRIYVKKLLSILGLEKNEHVTMGLFLKHLNHYLIDNNYINQDNFQVILSPLIGLAFAVHPSHRTVKYSELLKNTVLMFD